MFLISQVIPGIKAAIANVCVGDVTTAIDGENSSSMLYLEAQEQNPKGCTDNMTLTVATEQKYGLPLVTEEGKHHSYKMNYLCTPRDPIP